MAKSAAVYEKPTSHIGLPDWSTKQWELVQSATDHINDSFQLRSTARALRNETDIRTDWNTQINNSRLSDRIKEVETWHEILKTVLDNIVTERNVLKNARDDCERDLENLEHPLQTVAKCISMRDCRRETELTYDEADTELKKELFLIENIKKTLTDKVHLTWEKLNRLNEVIYQVNLDLENKTEALEIDKNNVNLNKNSDNISLKPNSMKILKSAVTYENWLARSENTRLFGQSEINDSRTLRESVVIVQKKAKNDIDIQQITTDYALRKRIYQIQRGRNEMKWQKDKVSAEMELLKKEIDRLEDASRAKRNVFKCAETRLENRTYRSGYELCQDEIDSKLREEVSELQQSKEEIVDQLNSAKTAYNRLESLLVRIERNLDDKEHALMTDVMCLDLRSALKPGDSSRIDNQTDRNIVLTKLEDEIPRES